MSRILRAMLACIILTLLSFGTALAQGPTGSGPSNPPDSIRLGQARVQVNADGSVTVTLKSGMSFKMTPQASLPASCGDGFFVYLANTGLHQCIAGVWKQIPTHTFTPLNPALNLSDLNNALTARANLGVAIGTDVQAHDADLDAVMALASQGFVVRTGSGSATTRSITPGSTKITITNGDGVSGNPSIDVAEGNLSLANLGGNLPVSKLNGGTDANSSTFWRGDGTWSTPPGGATANSTTGAIPYLSASSIYSDSPLFRLDANTIEQRNSTNGQSYRIYGSYTDASNYTRGTLLSSTSAVTLAAESAGTGSANIDVVLQPKGTGAVRAMPLLFKRQVIAKTSSTTLTEAESGAVVTNEGAGLATTQTLPPPVAGLTYTFVVVAGQNLNVTVNNTGTQTIRQGNSSATTITGSAIGNAITLVAVNNTTWVSTGSAGTW